ncbi:type I restriction-modification system subunit M [Ferrovum myxofaciens]|uniref:class I SAM-dependent DNA methyltransferase n=1 Tax=Ferrovum myxofaciens TaxID=416213 RepID=UPI003EB6AD10
MTETEFKKLLWDSANKLRGAMSAAEYKFPVLGLVFLKYVSDIFDAQREVIHYRLSEPESDLYMPENMREEAFLVLSEDRDAYKQDNVFWIPQEARFSELLKQAANPNLGKLLDDGMAVIERENEKLRGVLYRDFARLPLEAGVLGDLMNIVARMKFDPKQDSSRDVFGEVYEYFLGNFALSEGQRAGQFYTPRSVVSVLVEILAPFSGRIYDPACGSGGMFVYSERFIEAHGGKKGQAAIYGQELSATTRKLACMNLAIRGIDYDMGKAHGDTFHNDQHPDLRADFVLANPPFNIKGWGADKLPKDPRWKYGVPPDGNANYAWLQHMLARLSADGRAGIVLANGSLTTNTSGEGDIRASMVKGDVVECMVSLPGQLFANTQIPACLWFLSKNKGAGKNGKQDRRGQILFIDARKLAILIPGSRKQKEFSEDEIRQIAQTYHNWRGTQWGENGYEDVPGFCKSSSLDEIEKHGFALTPGRYVGATDVEDDDEVFEEQMTKLTSELKELFSRGSELEQEVRTQLGRVGYDI